MKSAILIALCPIALLSFDDIEGDLLSANTEVEQIAAQSESQEETRILIPELKGICLSSGEVANVPDSTEAIQFVGLTIPGGTKELVSRLNAFLGKPVGSPQLLEMKRVIAAYYQEKHFPLLTVHVPEQEITAGKVVLVLSESKRGAINVSGNRYFPSSLFQNAISISKGETINENVLLNNLNYLNRNPYHRVDVVYSKGHEKNTTDLNLIVKDRFPYNFYVGVDNTGLQSIQRTRIFGGFTFGKMFGLDQVLTIQYAMAPQFHKFWSVSASYLIPMPLQHLLNIYGGYSEVHAKVPLTTKTDGFSSQGSLRYTVPIPASSHVLHEAFAGFDYKRYNNTIEFVESLPTIGQNVNLTQFLAGYNFGYENGRHKFGFDVQLAFSPFEWVHGQSNADFESLNPDARHTYVYGRASMNYKVLIPGKWYWNFYAAGQIADKTLLPSEQFGLGGYATVRGYEERQLNADDAILIKTELLSPKWDTSCKGQALRFEFLGFLDYGYAHEIAGDTVEEEQNVYILGAGPGIRCSLGQYFLARVDWGIKCNKRDYPGGWSMIHFSATGSF